MIFYKVLLFCKWFSEFLRNFEWNFEQFKSNSTRFLQFLKCFQVRGFWMKFKTINSIIFYGQFLSNFQNFYDILNNFLGIHRKLWTKFGKIVEILIFFWSQIWIILDLNARWHVCTSEETFVQGGGGGIGCTSFEFCFFDFSRHCGTFIVLMFFYLNEEIK